MSVAHLLLFDIWQLFWSQSGLDASHHWLMVQTLQMARKPIMIHCEMWTVSLHRLSWAVFAKPFTSISPKNSVTIAAVKKKLRSAATETKEFGDFVQLTFYLDTINWRWRMREEECWKWITLILDTYLQRMVSRISTWLWFNCPTQLLSYEWVMECICWNPDFFPHNNKVCFACSLNKHLV